MIKIIELKYLHINNFNIIATILFFLLGQDMLGQLPQEKPAKWINKTITPVLLGQIESGELLVQDEQRTYLYDGIALRNTGLSLTPDLSLEKFIENNKEIIIPGNPIAFAKIPSGDNWLGVEKKGLFVITDGQLKEISFSFFPVDFIGRQISCLKTYGNKVYIGTVDKGLFCWDDSERELNKVFLTHDITFEILDVLMDSWGNLWIASSKGLLLKKAINWDTQIPYLRIDSIRLKESTFNTRLLELDNIETLQLDPTENNLEFHYSAVHLLDGKNISYQIKLSPIQKDWMNTQSKGYIEYIDLLPGKYEFQVKASVDAMYAAFTNSPKINIQQPTPFYIWWYVIGGFILMVGLWFIASIRSRLFIKKLKSDKEKLMTEKKLAQFQHKTLQLQMNPHFIFNAFNSIQGLVAEERNRDARKYLNKFAKLMRSVLEHSTQDWILLEEEIESLKAYLEIEQLCRPEIFSYKIDMTNELSSEDIQIPPMVIQPFIENAIKHGFKDIKRKGEIILNFNLVNNHILCTIDDNGIGLTASTHNKKTNHKSFAIQLITERLIKLTHLEKPVIYKEKLDEGGDRNGTKVTIYLPFK